MTMIFLKSCLNGFYGYSTFNVFYFLFSGLHLQCLHVQLVSHLDGHQLGLLAVLLLVDLTTPMSHNSKGCISLFLYRNHHPLGVVKDKLQDLI